MTKLSNLLTSGGLRIIDTQTYSANDTWTKPTGAVLVRVVMCGGGGSGRRPAANAAVSSGGSAATMVEMTFPAAGLGATESVVVGAGGAAVTVTNTNGNNGGYSAFGKLEAAGGLAGLTDDARTPTSRWHPNRESAMVAYASVSNGQDAPGASETIQDGRAGTIGFCGGGGGGVGQSNGLAGKTGGASSQYRAGGTALNLGNGGAGGTSGGATGGNGGTGANGDIRIGLGGEGGGAGGGGTSTGGNGGDGGVPGGGGGAGGFGTTTSGDSGAGGAGQVYVETWG